MILHELSHGAVAYFLGDDTAKNEGRLTLNPLKHLDPYMSIIMPVMLFMLNMPIFGGAKPVPVNREKLKGGAWGMALVALAGPLTNFLLALISFLFYYFSQGALDFMVISISVNLSLMVFNLIPIAPLDGSRILYAFAPDSVRSLMDYSEKYGIIVIYLVILLFGGFFSGFIIDIMNYVYQFFLMLVGL